MNGTMLIYALDQEEPLCKVCLEFDEHEDTLLSCGEFFSIWASDNGLSIDNLDWDLEYEDVG